MKQFLEIKVSYNRHAKSEALTVQVLLNAFFLRCMAINVSPRTLYVYKQKLNTFVAWCATQNIDRMVKIDHVHIRAFLADRISRNVSSLTVDGYYRVMKTFFRFVTKDYGIDNPMIKVERPKREKKIGKSFTLEKFRAMLNQIDIETPFGRRDFTFYVFLADTGMRLTEPLQMRDADIDWDKRIIKIMGKGARERIVPFGEEIGKLLKTWIEMKNRLMDTPWTWPNRYGQPIHGATISKFLKHYSESAGIIEKGLACHALRHFFALTFLRNKGDVMALQKILGHTDLTMTRQYINMIDDDIILQHRQAGPMDHLQNGGMV